MIRQVAVINNSTVEPLNLPKSHILRLLSMLKVYCNDLDIFRNTKKTLCDIQSEKYK